MPTYGTKVPYNGHICALPGAMIQNNLLDSLILIPDRGNFSNVCQIGKKQKGDKSLKNKTCLLNILYFTISFLTLPSLYFTMFTPLVGAVNRCPCDEKRDTSLTSDDTIVLSIPVSSDTVTMQVPT